MPRPREFLIDDVLRNAMEVFWRKGFLATSMSDIYGVTGLKPGNLYANFKDKDELFRRAFETYAAHFRATLPADKTGREAIATWLDTQVRLAVEDPLRRGCLIVNTITEREAHSAATRDLAAARLAEIRAFFRQQIDQAIDAGEAPSSLNRDGAADALVGAVVAIMSLARAGMDEPALRNIADQAMRSLDSAPEERAGNGA